VVQKFLNKGGGYGEFGKYDYCGKGILRQTSEGGGGVGTLKNGVLRYGITKTAKKKNKKRKATLVKITGRALPKNLWAEPNRKKNVKDKGCGTKKIKGHL